VANSLWVEVLGGFENLPSLLQFGEFAFLESEFLAHLGDLLFLLDDLLEDHFDGCLLDPGLSSGLGGGCGLGCGHTISVRFEYLVVKERCF
jgi:hypothetical protein